ncbi:MAG: hypothetical protein K0Q73_8580 [Paenibacillus sp.]|nr:hypothetical protein [Paenibacillus sp.]
MTCALFFIVISLLRIKFYQGTVYRNRARPQIDYNPSVISFRNGRVNGGIKKS